jgi:hypothetical protein
MDEAGEPHLLIRACVGPYQLMMRWLNSEVMFEGEEMSDPEEASETVDAFEIVEILLRLCLCRRMNPASSVDGLGPSVSNK